MAEIELWQAEWCPDSYLVRQRLTELGVDFLARQVPVDRAERAALKETTGQEGIPALVFSDGEVVTGDVPVLIAALDARYDDPSDELARENAAVAHERTPVGRRMATWIAERG
jgi:glutathione S-transferase